MRINCSKVIILLILFMSPVISFEQTVAIELMQENSLKVQNTNYIKIVADSVRCDSIVVQADAKITYEGNCIWKIIPMKFFKPFSFKFSILEKRGNDTIELHNKIFRTTKLNPLSINHRLAGSLISKEELINLGEIRTFEAFSKYQSYDTKVKSFKVLALRNGQIMFYHENKGYKFDEKLKERILDLKTNDILHFIDIENLNMDSIYLNPIPFKIKIKESN